MGPGMASLTPDCVGPLRAQLCELKLKGPVPHAEAHVRTLTRLRRLRLRQCANVKCGTALGALMANGRELDAIVTVDCADVAKWHELTGAAGRAWLRQHMPWMEESFVAVR